MKKIILFVIIMPVMLFSESKEYNLNKTFRIIKEYDKIYTSDNVEITFFVDAKYKFTEDGKAKYLQNVYDTKKELERFKNISYKNDNEKKESELNISFYESMLASMTPPENFVSFILNIALYEYISKYTSSYITNSIANDYKTFYKNIKTKIMESSTNMGYFTSLDFITEERFQKTVK